MMRQADTHSSRFSNRSIFWIIFISLTAAFLPVLLASYIRQDDMKWQLWPGMKIAERYDYADTIFQLVRPLSMLVIHLTDLVSYHMQNAVYVRFLNILFIILIANLLYWWQRQFNPNKLMAVCFSIAAFTMPCFQTFAATANYFHMLFTMSLATSGICLLWQNLKTNSKYKNLYFYSGILLICISFFDYPLGSLFGWTLIGILYLNLTESELKIQNPKFRFLIQVSAILMFSMVFYFCFMRIFQNICHVDFTHKRSSTVPAADFHIMLEHFWDTLVWHSRLWEWRDMNASPVAVILIAIIFSLGIICQRFSIDKKWSRDSIVKLIGNLLIRFFALTFLLFISYFPVVLSLVFNVNFRYTLATMPLLLYVIFWSVMQIGQLSWQKGIRFDFSYLLIPIAVYGVLISNIRLEKFIVGPQEQEINFLRRNIEQNVKPYFLQGRKITVQIIWTTPKNAYIDEYHAPGFEYGMRIRQYPDMCIATLVHILREMGFDFNYNNSKLFRTSREVGVITPWGIIDALHNSFATGVPPELPPGRPYPAVVIDMREIEPYSQFDLYRHFFESFKVRNSN